MGGTEAPSRLSGYTVKELQALRPEHHGQRVGLGEGMVGRVHVAADGAIGVHASWRYRFNGKTREIAVGTWRERGGMSLKALRDRRDAMAETLRGGVDPIEKERAERLRVAADVEQAKADERQRLRDIAAAEQAEAEAAAALTRRATVRSLFAQWQRAELAPHRLADGTRTGRKDGGEWVRQSFERRVFPRIGHTPIEDVTKADLLAILDDAKAEGRRRTANVLLADLRQMFRFAADREIVARNPLQGVARKTVGGKDVERERTLGADEIAALAAALPGARMQPRSEAAVRLILATAVRVGEAMGARWCDIDLDARTWHLPETENQRPHTVHLSDFALAQIRRLAELREVGPDGAPSPWLFPNTERSGPVCIKSFGKQLADRQRPAERRMQHRTQATSSLALAGGRWTAHDLRRTAATIMARLGVSTDVIDECLNHKLQSKVARVYIRDRREAEQARAFDALGAELARLVERREPAGNVVALRTA